MTCLSVKTLVAARASGPPGVPGVPLAASSLLEGTTLSQPGGSAGTRANPFIFNTLSSSPRSELRGTLTGALIVTVPPPPASPPLIFSS